MKWEFRGNLVEANIRDWENIPLNNTLFLKNDVANLEIKFASFKEVCFKNCRLTNVTFNNNFLVKVKFINCELTNVTITESNLNKVCFDNSKLTNFSFFATEIESLEVVESIVQYSKIENNKIDNAKFDDVRFRENIHRHNKYQNIEFYKCEFKEDNFIATNFKNCDLKTSSFKNVFLNLDDIISSKISMLNAIELLTDKGIIIEE